MGLSKVKTAVDEFYKKYEKSLEDYAKSGYLKSLAYIIRVLPESKSKEIIDSYPLEIKNRIIEISDEINAKIRTDPSVQENRLDRNTNHAVNESDLFDAEDFIKLEENLFTLNYAEFSELYSSYDGKFWLQEKIKSLMPLTIFLENNSNTMIRNKLIKELSVENLFAIETYGADSLKNTIWQFYSKQHIKELKKYFSTLSKPDRFDYISTLHHLNSFLKNNIHIDTQYMF